MDPRHLQMLMAATKDYAGGIDGVLGEQSNSAMQAIETRHAALYQFDPTSTTDARRHVGAAQACLDQLGYDPGLVDGWNGVNTTEALNAFLFKTTNGKEEVIDRTPEAGFTPSGDIPKQSQVENVYGDPETEIPSRLELIELPFDLRLDFNLRKKTRRIRVHRDCAAGLKTALIAVHAHYGPAEMTRLGIDRYAGAYNKRKMRGGTKWSMHAYGCAIDFFAEPNGLRMRCPEALFCKPEYKPFLDIMEQNEWLPALRLWGADAMHFQRARLD